jgi:hypothetical protein
MLYPNGAPRGPPERRLARSHDVAWREDAAMKQSIWTRVKHWLAARLPPCEDMARTASESFERPLTLRERADKRLHLFVCAFCSRYLAQVATVRALVREARPEEPPMPLEARERMRRRLRGLEGPRR